MSHKRYEDRRAYALSRSKTYAPDWTRPKHRWKIVKQERISDFVVLLCQKYGDEFAVFTDLLSPKSYPSDKFTSGRKSGEVMFKEIVADMRYEMNTICFPMHRKCSGCHERWFIRVSREKVMEDHGVFKPLKGKCTYCGKTQKVEIKAV